MVEDDVRNTYPSCADIMKKIWKLNIPPKVKVFGWLLIKNRLQTRKIICRFKNSIDPSCAFCQNDIETQDHIMCMCPFAQAVWTSSNLLCIPDASNNIVN